MMTYNFRIETCDFKTITFQRTMPKPKSIKARNNELSRWVEREFPYYTSYEITPV